MVPFRNLRVAWHCPEVRTNALAVAGYRAVRKTLTAVIFAFAIPGLAVALLGASLRWLGGGMVAPFEWAERRATKPLRRLCNRHVDAAHRIMHPQAIAYRIGTLR